MNEKLKWFLSILISSLLILLCCGAYYLVKAYPDHSFIATAIAAVIFWFITITTTIKHYIFE